MMTDRTWRIVIGVGVAAGFFAIALSLLNGSHFEWKTGPSGMSFDVRIGGGGGLQASIFGTISVLCLLLGGAFLAASLKPAAGAPGESQPEGAPPFIEFLKALKRSSTDFWVGGVCGGLGRYSQIPTWIWRAVFLVLILCFGTGVFAYIILWACIPKETASDFRVPVPPPMPPVPPSER